MSAPPQGRDGVLLACVGFDRTEVDDHFLGLESEAPDQDVGTEGNQHDTENLHEAHDRLLTGDACFVCSLLPCE